MPRHYDPESRKNICYRNEFAPLSAGQTSNHAAGRIAKGGKMHRNLPAAALLLALAACQAAPSAAPAQNFVAAANALAQAESDYFDQIQAASDASHVLDAGVSYVAHHGSFATIQNELAARDDFSHDKAVRVAVMAQLRNYAQQLAAITAAAGGSWIADDAKSATAGMPGLLKRVQRSKLPVNQGAVQTAVTDLGNAIINNATATELQDLAKQASGPIAGIANMVAQDNIEIESDNFAIGLVNDQNEDMLDMLADAYADPQAGAAARFSVFTTWQGWHPVLVTKGKDIADAMAKLTKANDALAAGQTVSAAALAQQAFASAHAAAATPSPTK